MHISADNRPPGLRLGRGHRLALSLAMGLLAVFAAGAAAQPAAEPSIYRIFLKTGTPLVSWGEFARVGDRVVFTLPLGDPSRPDDLQVVSLPSEVVDWERTDRYADTVRYHRYAQTRGEADYKALTDDLANALTSIALSKDPVARLAAAEEARRRLVEWPAQHFGYRASDVRDLASAVEETIAGIRADAGERHFSIDLVATLEAPSAMLLPPPGTRESIELAIELARSTDVAADRLSLQESILVALARTPAGADAGWSTLMRRRLRDSAREAAWIDRRYAALVSRTSRDAASRAAQGDVAGVQRLMARVERSDAWLGRRRAREIRALLAGLERQLDAARQRRLVLDRWKYRDETYRAYRIGLADMLKRVDEVAGAAEAVRSMSGPGLRELAAAERRLAQAGYAAALLSSPDDLHASHAALVSGLKLMQTAFGTRRAAMVKADLEAARNASAAAAGALLLVAQSRAQIHAYFAYPKAP